MHMKHLEYIIIYMSTDVSSPWRFSWGVIPILSDYQVLVMVKNPPASAGNAWDAGLIPVSGRSPGVGNGNQLWYPGLEYPMDRGVWWAIVHGIGKSQTWLSTHTHTHTHIRIIYWQYICHGQMKSGESNWKHEDVIAIFLVLTLYLHSPHDEQKPVEWPFWKKSNHTRE